MKALILGVCLAACALAVPTVLSAADAPAHHMADCCNTTCPVDEKPVDPAVKPMAMAMSDKVKKDNPGIETSMVGFCSDHCRMAYEKEPAKYESKLVPHWQAWKNNTVK